MPVICNMGQKQSTLTGVGLCVIFHVEVASITTEQQTVIYRNSSQWTSVHHMSDLTPPHVHKNYTDVLLSHNAVSAVHTTDNQYRIFSFNSEIVKCRVN